MGFKLHRGPPSTPLTPPARRGPRRACAGRSASSGGPGRCAQVVSGNSRSTGIPRHLTANMRVGTLLNY
ncbi:MAG: hypothetical protein WKG07_38365 [Hymenobacter sp.]